jgi:Putative beta-barrel porin 2
MTPRAQRQAPQRTSALPLRVRACAPALHARACALALLLPFAAFAEGPGVLVGESARLHFLFDLEGRYDSLAGQGPVGINPQDATTDPADILFHVRPGLRLAAPGSRLDFDANAALDWTRYTGWLGATTSQLSYLGATAGATLEVGKGGPLTFHVGEQFNRSDRTTNPAIGLGTLTNANTLGASLTARPGGGAIEATLGYDFALESYQSYNPNTGAGAGGDANNDPSQYSKFSNQTHKVELNSRWRFLPKTAVILDGSWAFRVYDSSSVNVATSPLRVEAGLAGLLTEKVRITLRAGWMKMFAASGSEFQSVIGLGEVGWNPTETAGLTLGLSRSAEPVSSTYGWYDDWRAYLQGRIALGGRAQLTGGARIDRIAFADPATAGAANRTDTQAALDLAVDVEVMRLLHVLGGTTVTSRSSSAGGYYTYSRAEAWLKLQFSY